MFYGIAWCFSEEGKKSAIVTGLRATNRTSAIREARRICWQKGYVLEDVHVFMNYRKMR